MTDAPKEDLKMRLQDSLVRELLRRVDSGEAQAADLNVARQLLKDIGVNTLISEEATKRPAFNLLDRLPFKEEVG